MPSNREITFVLKVQNDAKQGLQSVGVDFDSLARRVNDLGTKQGASAQRGLTGIQAQARAIREMIAAYRQAGVAQERLNRLQAQNRAANRVSTARARDAENITVNREAARSIDLRNRQAIAEQRLQRELDKTAQATRLAADAAKTSRERTVSAAQVAQSNAKTVIAVNELRVKEAQLRVDKQILKVQQEQVRLDSMKVASQARQTAAAQAQLVLEQRIAAASAQTARQQALAANAAARNQGFGGGTTGRRGSRGLFSSFFGGFLGGGGGGGGGGFGGDPRSGLGGIASASSAATLGVRGLSRAFTALGAAVSAVKLIQYADQYKLLNARVSIVTDGLLQQKLVFQGLVDTANASRVALSDVTTTYYGLARNNEALGLSQADLLSVTETISKSIAVSGTNAQAAAFGLIQLSQAFGTGQLRGEELNSVLEQLPALAQVIARNIKLASGEIGVGAAGALKTLAEQGKLTIPQILDAIRRGAADIEAQFKKIPVTVTQGLSVLGNGLTVFVGELDRVSGITAAIGGAFKNLGLALTGPELKQAARDVGAALGGVGSIISAVISPLVSLLGDNLVSVMRTLLAVIAGITLSLSAWAIGRFVFVPLYLGALKAAASMAALRVSMVAATQMAGVTAGAFGVTAAAADLLALSASRVNMALMRLMTTPWGAALLGIAAAMSAVWLSMAIRPNAGGAEELINDIKTIKEQMDALTDKATTDGILDFSKLTKEEIAKYDELTRRYVDAGQRLAEAQADARKVLEKEQEKLSKLRQERAKAGREGIRASLVPIPDSPEVIAARANLDAITVALDEFNAALRTVGVKRGTDPTQEIQGFIQSIIGSTEPALAKAQELEKIGQTFRNIGLDASLSGDQLREFFENDASSVRDSPWLRALTVLKFGLKDVEDASRDLQFELLQSLYEGGVKAANDNPLAKAFRDAKDELFALQQAASKGGKSTIQDKLVEVAKQLAAEQGGQFAQVASYYATVERSGLRQQLIELETLRIRAEITKQIDEGTAALDQQALAVRYIGTELKAQRAVEAFIAKEKAKNAQLTDKQAEIIRNDLLPALRQQAETELRLGVYTEFVDQIREVKNEKAALDAILAIGPEISNSELEYIDFLKQLANQASITYEELLKLISLNKPISLGNGQEIAPEQIAQRTTELRTATSDRDQVAVLTAQQEAMKVLLDQEKISAQLVAAGAYETERRRLELEKIYELIRAGTPEEEATAKAAADMANYDQARAATAAQQQGVVGMINGMKRGFSDFLTESADMATQFADITKNAFNGISNTIAELVTTGKANFKALTASILRDIATMIVKFLVLRAIMAALNFVAPGLGTAFGAAAGVTASEKGNVFQAGRQVQKYARGGLITKPTFFPMANGGVGLMGEAGAEAIMPLRRLSNGRLGVESTGGATTNNVFSPSIVITVEGGSSKDRDENENLASNIGDQVNKIMEAKMAEFAQRQSRNGGMLRTALEL